MLFHIFAQIIFKYKLILGVLFSFAYVSNFVIYNIRSVLVTNKLPGAEDSILIFNTNQQKKSKLSSNYAFEDEWIAFSESLVLKRSSSFYFHDDSQYIILGITKHPFNLSLSCSFYVNNDEVFYSKANITRIHESEIYDSIAIECTLYKSSIKLDDSIELYIKDDITKFKLKTPIAISIESRILAKKKIKTRGEFLLCSRTLYGRFLSVNEFRLWIEMNKRIGFERIVLYNSSIPYDGYVEIFDEYEDFLELRPHYYYPQLYLTKNMSYFTSLHNTNILYYLRTANERVAINECYLSNRYYYKHIAVYDTDEFILPKFDFNIETNCLNTQAMSKTPLALYFEKLNEIDAYKNANSYWFPYQHFFHNTVGRKLYNDLKNSYESDERELETQINVRNDQYLKFIFNTDTDKAYLQYQLNQYDFLLLKNHTSFNTSKDYDFIYWRLFSFTIGIWKNDAKSIHFTDKVKYVSTHHAFTRFTQISSIHGTTLHFRRKFFLHTPNFNYELSIRNLSINLNYFICYFDEVKKYLFQIKTV